MAETIRTLAGFNNASTGLFKDNTEGDISAQDLRDFVATAVANKSTYASNQTLTAAECTHGVCYVTGAATITLPAIAEGMCVAIIVIGAVEVSVDPNGNDKIWLDGAALGDGKKITSKSTAGDIAVLTYYSADGWHASTNGWTGET
jgi:hypothetical protein